VSHITKRKSSMTDLDVIKKACERHSDAAFRGVRGNAAEIKFGSWQNPVRIDLQTGECAFDNYGGRWGKNEVLEDFMQGYGVEAVKNQATLEGFGFEEELLANGAIKCVVPIGGGGGLEGFTAGTGGDMDGW
jgi:hypothetical protein